MHRLTAILMVLPALALAACAAWGGGDRPGDDMPAFAAEARVIGWEVLREGSYPLPAVAGGWARLRDGFYEEPHGAATLRVELASRVAFGDLNGDGVLDAAVLLVSGTGATLPQQDVAAVLSRGGGGWSAATAPLGVGATVDALHIDAGGISLTARYSTPAPVLVQRRYRAERDRLALVEERALALKTTPLDLAGFNPHALAPRPERPQIIDGVVGPHSADRYVVRAVAGQRLSLRLEGMGRSLRLGLAGPGALLALEAGLPIWEGGLPSDGDYLIAVLADGANTPYRLEVRMTAPPRPTTGPLIYLTFDDGPDPTYTPQVLDLLARYGARATFFVIGRSAAAHPELIQRIAAEGHTLGNHTYNHPSLAGMGREQVLAELGRTQEALGGLGAACMRPPYGAEDQFTATYAAELGLSVVRWGIDPQDWARPGAATIAAHVLARAHPGAIVLFHDGGGDRSQTVAALEPILSGLSAQGYQFEPYCR